MSSKKHCPGKKCLASEPSVPHSADIFSLVVLYRRFSALSYDETY